MILSGTIPFATSRRIFFVFRPETFHSKGKAVTFLTIFTLFADLGFDSELANGFFILARTAGWMAHVAEEFAREKPMRRIDQGAADYDGPGPRGLA